MFWFRLLARKDYSKSIMTVYSGAVLADDKERGPAGVVNDAATGSEPVYGVNTGFGKLASVKIDAVDTEELQRNLILSHCCGVGAPTPYAQVRLMMALKLISLGRGASGVRWQVIEQIEALLNHRITPIVPHQHVDAPRITRTGDALPALGKIHVEIAVAVVVGPHHSVVSRVVARRNGRGINQARIRHHRSIAEVPELRTLRIIMAGEQIKPAVRIDIHEAHHLQEDRGRVEIGPRVGRSAVVGTEVVQAIVVAARHNVRVAIVVGIAHRKPPHVIPVEVGQELRGKVRPARRPIAGRRARA